MSSPVTRISLIIVLLLSANLVIAQRQRHSSFPLDVTCRTVPRALNVFDTFHLSYELHITNFAPFAVRLTSISIAGDSGTVTSTLAGEDLSRRFSPARSLLSGITDTGDRKQTLQSGETGLVFIDLPIPAAGKLPSVLHHHFQCAFTGKNGQQVDRSFDMQPLLVDKTPAPVLHPPVRGRGWIAFNAYGGTGHRRSFNPVDGRLFIAERFAIDFMQLAPDGKLLNGDPKKNKSFYCYGAPLLAVADGRVCDMADGFEDNKGTSERTDRAITLDNIVGNYITLDLGNHRYAIYAHLQPGNLKVHIGEKVVAGQVLGYLGNSGNSDEPHLHFQLMDANSPLGAEGIPYHYTSFTVAGVIADPDALDQGKPWTRPVSSTSSVRHRQFPGDNTVLDF